MNRIVHFEIPVNDVAKNVKFYGDVFGWTFQQFGDENYLLCTTGKDGPGIDGAIMKKRDANQPIVNSIEVASVDEMAKKIEAAGGIVVVPKMAVPSVGYLAYFKDPDGNISGLWQPDKAAK